MYFKRPSDFPDFADAAAINGYVCPKIIYGTDIGLGDCALILVAGEPHTLEGPVLGISLANPVEWGWIDPYDFDVLSVSALYSFIDNKFFLSAINKHLVRNFGTSDPIEILLMIEEDVAAFLKPLPELKIKIDKHGQKYHFAITSSECPQTVAATGAPKRSRPKFNIWI